MKRTLFFVVIVMAAVAAWADAPEIIYNQPTGTLRIYNRHGMALNEDMVPTAQTGTMAVVVADDGNVYMQDVVSSYTMAGTWVKGSLSQDGKAITVSLGQYLDYTRSFDMAYQLQMLNYDTDRQDYVLDETATEAVYTIGDDGTITLTGTSQQHILGIVFRTFGNPQGASIGQDFMYLDNTWAGAGDYDSSYTLFEEQAQQAPNGLETAAYYATSAEFDGAQYTPYNCQVLVGWDSDDLWVQGLSWLLPSAWAKGTRQGDKVVFDSGQFLGTVEGIPLYLLGASLDADGNFAVKSIEMTIEDDVLTTYDYFFVSTSATALEYVNFYMGMTLSEHPDALVGEPVGLETVDYVLNFRDADGRAYSQNIKAVVDDGEIWLKGLWQDLPDAWVKGMVTDGQVVFQLPQYLGTYTDEGSDYPIYVTAFNEQTGALYRQLTFDYDAIAGSMTNASSAISVGINKTGYLSVQDYYQPTLTASQSQGIHLLSLPVGQPLYDLNGRRQNGSRHGIYIKGGKKFVR